MAIGTPRCLPDRQTRLHLVAVLRKCRSRIRKSRNNKGQNDPTRAECEFPIPNRYHIQFTSHSCLRRLPVTHSPHAASFRIKLIVVITPIRLVSVIKQTFLFGNFSLSNYSPLKIGHHIVDLLGTELTGCRVKVPAASGAPACTLLECRHSGAWASALDCELGLCRVEPCPWQISCTWR